MIDFPHVRGGNSNDNVLTVSLLPRGWADMFKSQGGYSIGFFMHYEDVAYSLPYFTFSNKHIQGS